MTPEQFARVQDLFKRGLALPSSEREAFLRSACPDDAEVRDRVERMLAHASADAQPGEDGDAAGGFLESPALGRGFHVGPAVDVDRRIEEEFSRVGRYRLIERIGEGGFGSVYRAEQREPVRREVAIKLIKPGMDTRRVLSRFEAERQTLARMSHPGIAAVFDAGVTESGRPYFAMELADGAPITAYCESRRLGLRERLALFQDVCAAVQHAHQKGVIHRDLKPSNVLVADPVPPETRPRAKVIDFGIAKAVAANTGGAPTLMTEAGQMIGTPEYMSPEQASGSADIDTRADIYSLGVVLYELLTGTTPLDRRQTPELATAGPARLQRLIAELSPPPPSTRVRTSGARGRPSTSAGADAPALARQLRGDLDWIVLKAIEADRERRYDSAAALADDLGRFARHEPVIARPPTTVYRLSRFARKHRVALAAAGAVAAALVAGIAGTSVGLLRAVEARDAEAMQRRRADDEATTAKAIASFLNEDLLAAVKPEAAGRDVSVRQVLDEASRRIEGRFVDQPLVEAGVRAAIGASYSALGQYDRATSHLERARELRAAALGPDAAETLDITRSLGTLRGEQGRLDDAAAMLSDVLERRRRAHPGARVEQTRDMHFLARVEVKRGRVDEAERLYRELIAASISLHGPDHAETLAARSNLISLLQSSGRFEALEPEIEATIASQTRVDGADHPRTLFTRGKQALLYYQTNRLGEAEARYNEVIGAMKRVFGPEHPYTMYVMGDLCTVYLAQNRLEDAERLRLVVVDGLTRSLGADSAETLVARERLGDVYYQQERYDAAEPVYRAVLEGNRKAFGPEHPYTRATELRLARTMVRQGRAAEAEPMLAGLVASSRAGSGSKLAELLVARAEALEQLGRAADAEAMLREVTEMPDGPSRARRDLLGAIRGLVRLCESSGRTDEAAAWRARLEDPEKR